MTHGQRKLIFDLHALRQLARTLVLAQAEAFKTAPIHFLIPLRIKAARRRRDLCEPLARVIAQPARNKADLLPDGVLVARRVQPEELHLSPVRVHEAQKRLECGRFACAVAADEAHDRALFHGK